MFLSKITVTLTGLLFCYLSFVNADTPANCTYEDIRGQWLFQVGEGNQDRTVKCSNFSGPFQRTLKINLVYPDVAVDEYGNKGFWTIIYNQGFEVVVAGRKYFAFSSFDAKKKTSFCHSTMPGWSHDVMGHDWACYIGKKNSGPIIKEEAGPLNILRFGSKINSAEMVSYVNKVQKSWMATRYPQFESMTTEELVRMAGGKASRVASRPKPIPLTEEHKRIMSSLPDSFDWRKVNDISFVSPVRNQGGCGSCYAFASMAMNEARVRIQTNNTQKPVFSPQDVVECSEYAQGCEGGFPYLIGGKYAEDFGLVDEKCNPYTGRDRSCSTDPKCARHYATNYKYVGGYYGGCNEYLMMQAVHDDGPIAISFMVYNDFLQYKSGIYHHVPGMTLGLQGHFDPFEITNHVVLVVGWGVSKTGEKYWIVKNSWGTEWGIEGYFWISKGNDECGFESIAVESFPIFDANH